MIFDVRHSLHRQFHHSTEDDRCGHGAAHNDECDDDDDDTYVDERPCDDPRRPEQRRYDPGDDNHCDGTARRPSDAVLEWASDTHVPVETDEQQVRYRRVADRVVE